MSITRVTHKQVAFSGPFQLHGYDETFPAGDYDVETDEELIEGVSFLAYRRTATLLHVRSKTRSRILAIDPRDLDLAILVDRNGCGAMSQEAAPKQGAQLKEAVARAENEGMTTI